MQNIFIAGCGYIGERIARLYLESGAAVTCLVRSPEHAGQLETIGCRTITATLDAPDTLPLLPVTGAILFYLVPPPGGGILDSRARNFISTICQTGRPAKIVYMSATSVYSEVDGGIVTEISPTLPETAMGKRRLDAEAAFLEYGAESGIPVVILRVSGIYGPGRLPLMQISQGQPLLCEAAAGPSNRIHADDLAAICIAAAERGADGDVFNVSDGHPSSMTAYFNACADALGYPRQPQVSLDEARLNMSPLLFSYFRQCRVVDNSRMLAQLEVKLRYANLEEGLAASVPQAEAVISRPDNSLAI